MNKSHQKLERQIEELVRAHLESCRKAAEVAIARAFTAAASGAKTAARQERKTRRAQRPPRSAEELARLEEQFLAEVCTTPGETMHVLAARLGMPSHRLSVPAKRLKRTGRVRIVGQRNGARYFPMAAGRATLVSMEAQS